MGPCWTLVLLFTSNRSNKSGRRRREGFCALFSFPSASRRQIRSREVHRQDGFSGRANSRAFAICIESAETPILIETLARRGYRFIALVVQDAAPQSGTRGCCCYGPVIGGCEGRRLCRCHPQPPDGHPPILKTVEGALGFASGAQSRRRIPKKLPLSRVPQS